MTHSATGEYHFTHRRFFTNRTRNNLTIALALVALFATYAGVQLHNDNVEARAQIQAFNARGCPDKWKGKPFLFSAEENVNVLRPGTSRIACYYSKATVQS